MVEAGANEIPEAEILDALDIAHDEIKKLCAAQRELAEKAGKEKIEIEVPAGRRGAAASRSQSSHGAALDAATQVEDKLERQDATKAVEEAVLEQYSGDPEADDLRRVPPATRSCAFDKLEKTIIRERIAVHKKRPDGRGARRDPRRSRSRSASLRARTARRCSRAARRRRSASSRSAPRARRCASTRSGSRPPSATGTTTTSRRSRSGRPASCAAPSAATSATARSPSGRSCR